VTRCAQCGVAAPIALHHEDHGGLCSLCASRQVERDEQRGLLSASMFGFTGDDADRWDD
jgi:recombinational DNA repair protein (RecF pathway)